MKVADSRAAARAADMKRDPVTRYWDPVEPADPVPIHAWLYSADPGPPIDWFRDAPKSEALLRRWILAQQQTALLEDGAFVRAPIRPSRPRPAAADSRARDGGGPLCGDVDSVSIARSGVLQSFLRNTEAGREVRIRRGLLPRVWIRLIGV